MARVLVGATLLWLGIVAALLAGTARAERAHEQTHGPA